ncbi:cytochrome b/b6 domain-containing protein [Notoacmeibacter ruber]|uniref:Lipid/polyisoprenoid-binding YceI-like domain-containing protein n=1 Tax=Notoacmeibacter ruber TaxID=2670375 RepID=A0A3L7J9S5_9HYPH|nr:cytochrome b/b6 domain-containing protein [Notoacmeibacter ruber]RLQ87507.1 hypothetical protein D8780_04090 [Notoacmeibacter ruber]
MRVLNTVERYGAVAALFHWAIATLILVLLPLGIYMHELPQGTGSEVSQKIWLYSLHKTLGVSVFTLAVLRVIWAAFNRRPAPIHAERRVETFLAEAVHWALYGAILATPLAGWIYHAATQGFAPIWWPFSQELPFVPENDRAFAGWFKRLHAGLAITMIGLVALHVLGAFKHVLVDRDGTLARMVPGWRIGNESAARARLAAEAGHHHAPAFIVGLIVLAVAASVIAFAESAEGGRKPDEAAVAVSDSQSPDAASQGNTQSENGSMVATDAASSADAVEETSGEPGNASDASAGGAPLWAVDQQASELGITVAQNGSPTEGTFEQWNAEIRFDPEALDQSSVRVEVEVGSLSIGDVSDTAKSLLQAQEQPVAVWSADQFRQTGDNAYEAEGTLELAGQSAPLTLPFTLNIDGDTAEMQSETTIQRLDWGVGANDYPEGDTVGLDVTLRINVSATRQE